MRNHLETLSRFVAEHRLDSKDLCIVGGLALEIRGVRKAGDIDIIIHPQSSLRKKLRLKTTKLFPWKNKQSHVVVREVDIHFNRFNSIGWNDEEFFKNDSLFETIHGYPVVRPELELLDRILVKPHKRLGDAGCIYQSISKTWDERLFMNLLFNAQQNRLVK